MRYEIPTGADPTQTAGMGWFGPPLPDLEPGFKRDWFAFGTNQLFSGTGQSQVPVIQIDKSADFEFTQLCAVSDQSTQPTIICLINIRDTTTGYALLNTKVPVEHIATTPLRNSVLDATHRFAAGATIALELTNQGVANQTVFLTMRGYRILKV